MLPPPTARMATTMTMTTTRATIALPRHHARITNGKQQKQRRRIALVEPPSAYSSSSSSSSSSTATSSSSSPAPSNLIAANLTSWLVARGAMPPSDKASVVLVTANDDSGGGIDSDGDTVDANSAKQKQPPPPPLLAASKKLPRGSPALSVPEVTWIHGAAVDASPLGEATKGLEPWLRLALLLLHARSSEGVTSPLAPYASALPAEPDAPVFWSDRELELLAGTQVGDAVAGYRAFFAARHAQLEASLFSKNRGLFPEASFSAPAFAWAAATVRARLFAPLDGGASGGSSGSGSGSGEASTSSSPSSPDDVAIVPGIDLASHSRSPNALLRVSRGGGGGGGGVGGGVGGFLGGLGLGGMGSNEGATSSGGGGGRVASLEVTSDRDLGPGEALTIDFGPGRTDSQVLLDHGAVDPAAPRPGFVLTLALPRELERTEGEASSSSPSPPSPPPTFFDDKLDIAEGAGYGPTATFVLDPRARAPPQEMLCYLRLMNLGGADAFLLEPVFRDEVWSRHVQEPISRENERAVCASMASGCAAALARIGGDAASDERELAGGDLSRRADAALRVRCGERAALAAAARWFAGRAASLDFLEYYQERRLRGLGLLDEEGRSSYDDFFKDGIA